MATRFENGIVVTLGQYNRVLWNATVVTDGELIAAVGDSAKMKERFSKAKVVDCTARTLATFLLPPPSPAAPPSGMLREGRRLELFFE